MVQLLKSRSIPYVALRCEHCWQEDALRAFLVEHRKVQFVLNALFEQPEESAQPDFKQWYSLAQRLQVETHANKQVLLLLSSAQVFSGGSARPYLETDQPDAGLPYGDAMAAIEQSVLKAGQQSIVVRVGWLFSDQPEHFLACLVDAAVQQEKLSFSGKLSGNPTDSNAVAKVFLAIAEQVDCGVEEPALWGIYHYADSDACTMHTFAKAVITVVKSMTEVRVESILESDSPDMVDAVLQPENYELSCRKILSTFGIKQRPWRRSVQEVLTGLLDEQVI